MLECPDCGVPNAATSTFCIRCGRELPVQLLIDEDVVIPEVITADGNALLDEAVECYAAGNLDDAAVACHKALDASPELVAARALLARVEEERGNLAAAAAEYEAVARLEPGRLVERERADKLRAELDRQAISADVLKDPSFDFRRRLPLIVGIAVAFLFLLISSLLLASRGNQQQADNPGMNGEPGTVAGMPLNPNDMPAPVLDAMGQPIDAGTGFTGPGIGMENGVQVQQQTNLHAVTTPTTDADGNYYPSPTNNNNNGVRPAAPPSLGNPPALPPPTIGGQNATTGVLRLPPGASSTRPAPAPNASETSAPQPPRGRIRIWTGDEDEAGESAPAPAAQSNAGNVQPGRVIAPGSWGGQSGTVVPTAPRNTGGQGYAAAPTARSGSSTRTASAGNRQFPAPTTNSGQAGGNTADNYRNKAQQALSSGRHNEAKDLFRSAMNSYEAQSQRDPGRAAVNRSAAESCRRALEVLDAGS